MSHADDRPQPIGFRHIRKGDYVIAALKGWLVSQGFTERAATLVMWQAAILGVVLLTLLAIVVMRGK